MLVHGSSTTFSTSVIFFLYFVYVATSYYKSLSCKVKRYTLIITAITSPCVASACEQVSSARGLCGLSEQKSISITGFFIEVLVHGGSFVARRMFFFNKRRQETLMILETSTTPHARKQAITHTHTHTK